MDTFANISQNIFAYFSVSEHLFLFSKKHLFWLRTPSPPRYVPVCNFKLFFTPSLSKEPTQF